MKRSPLKRSSKPLARSPMKRRPKRNTASEKATLAQFAAEFADCVCWVCGLPGRAHPGGYYGQRMTIDHIAGRNSKHKHHRTNLLWCAWYCHQNKLPDIEGKIERKKRYDAGGFDPVIFAKIASAKSGRNYLGAT